MKKFKIIILLLCLITPISFVACENKNKDTLSTPTILEVKGSTIVFNPVKDAEYYTLSINDNTLSIDVKHNSNVSIIDNKINYDASKIFVVGESYSIKIKANSSKKNSSSFSKTYSYKYNGNIDKPTNVKINATTLTWDTVENASYYLVKIITPNDTILMDKSGNVLPQDDPDTIYLADLTEYSFNTNQFDFGSILSKAGTYKFYVSAVLANGSTYVESGYSSNVNYVHYVTLKAPKNGTIKKVGENLHLLTAVDSAANAISISCNGFEKTVEINGSEQSLDLISANLIDVNLNLYFKEIIDSKKLDFNQINQFVFKTQSKFITSNSSYYINSNQSNYVVYENTQKLTTPELSLEFDNINNCFSASWSCEDKNLASSYKLIVCTSTEIKEYTLTPSTESMLIYEDFISIAVKAVGSGNYLDSNFSNFVSNPNLTNTLTSLDFNIDENVLSWNNLSGAYYIIEKDGSYFKTTDTSLIINLNDVSSSIYNIKITAIKTGYTHQTKSIDLECNPKLARPIFNYGQGFASRNLYELTFTGSNNAFGYYVYVKSSSSSEFVKINTLYTSTTIDLSQYIASAGEYTDYEVKVQAVADIHSIYADSELSSSVSVSHTKVLEKPEFYKISNVDTPITKTTVSGTTKYILNFYGVADAGSYEILINYNKLTIDSLNPNYTGIYEIDVSNYLISANNYEIKLRALPADSAFNVQASDYNVANYALRKQLSMVENIRVTENDGIYTLSFTPVDNAQSYRIRIIKENDGNYYDYLKDLGLSNSFVVSQATDITDYLKQQGVYYFYVTALAQGENGYYADANESTTFATVSKLTTLDNPKEISFTNDSQTNYELSWIGDDNADYYLIKLVDPQKLSYEFKVYDETKTNINSYMTVQGDYSISIYSMVNPVGETAKEFSSSSATNVTHRYIYQTENDFIRYSVSMYGSATNFKVQNVTQLKNLLWYHYLYEIDINTYLSLMLDLKEKEDGSFETIREAILRLANEANSLLLHKFAEDQEWNSLVAEETTSDNDLFSYMCQKLLLIYPEFNILEGFDLDHTTNNTTFKLYYKNTLNQTKIKDTASNIFTNKNYGNDYQYIDIYSRKSATGVFNIDYRDEMVVTTTEQLLQAVQHNKKPKFVGNSETAEKVYDNAKTILSAIVTNNMTDLEKVTAIFDWLEYAYDLTYYTIDEKSYMSGLVEKDNLSKYGLYKQYYLEGLLEDISLLSNGDIKVGNNLATSWSYSKAFALLCAIEGIDATVVNGTYSFIDPTNNNQKTKANHVWNKVCLDTSVDGSGKNWYAVDLTFSDNRIYFSNLNSGYGISSHAYFLTTDNMMESNLSTQDNCHLISNDYKTTKTCETEFNYYSNSSFGLTLNQMESTLKDFKINNDETGVVETKDFVYAKEFNSTSTYQKYAQSTGFGPMQAYLMNALIYANYKANNNSHNRSVFEFRYNWKDYGETFDPLLLIGAIESAHKYCGERFNLITEAGNNIYNVRNATAESKYTTIIFIVEKTA